MARFRLKFLKILEKNNQKNFVFKENGHKSKGQALVILAI
jgi:hypothetical protein